MLHAHATRWFEIITTRQDFAAVMHELARSGAAQLEAKPLQNTQPVLPRLAGFHDAFGALGKKYALYWPDAKASVLAELKDPAAILESSLEDLHRWAKLADPVIARLQHLQSAQSDLHLIRQLIQATGSGHPFATVPGADRRKLAQSVYYLAGAKTFETESSRVLCATVPTATGLFVIAIASPAEMAGFETAMAAQKAVLVPAPDFLSEKSEDHAAQVETALAGNAAQIETVKARLDWLADEFRLADILANIAVLTWLFENIDDVQATARTIRITGWTSSDTGQPLRDALDAAGLNYVLSVVEAAPEANAPMFLRNPFWLKSFEFFPRMLGVPARNEADPSVITAMIAPLMFGYMFGDVGQGAILIVVGLLMQKQMPLLALLVPGGIAAMLFGVLFGSVFSREDVIAPLWLHPLDEPITVLLAALVIGIVFLLLGVVVDFLQALWRGATLGWLWQHGGVILAYLCLLGAYWLPFLLWGVPLGVAATAFGARNADGAVTPMAVAAALGEFVETLMRLMVSSVSFSRVGAFALAHAGLSAAVIGIGEMAGGVGYWVILLFGNILILALEGLVTGIQTTRLILFEFFTRFFHAGGREFRPLQSPEIGSSQHKGNSI